MNKHHNTETEVTVAEREDGLQQGRTFAPRADILESADAVTLLAELPGVSLSDVDVTLERGVLTVRGRASEEAPEGMRAIWSEYEVGGFERTFRLSDEIDAENIRATMNHGVLELVLAKRSPERLRIPVKVGGSQTVES